MITQFKKSLKIILPLLMGVFFIWISYTKLTEEERSTIWVYIKEANYFWVITGVFLGFLSHLSRAYRWRFMLEPLGFLPRYGTMVASIGIGYIMNLVIPRSGEVSRALVVQKQDGVPMSKAFGTIVAERVFDLVVLMILIATAFFLQFDELSVLFERINIQSLLLLASIASVLLVLFLWFIFKSNNNLAGKIRSFVLGIWEGIQTIWKMEKKWQYVFHTVLIWSLYVLMFYIVIFALPETENIPFPAVLTAFVVGSLAVAFTNGGLGAYPFFVAEVLALFGIALAAGTAFGWIVWLSQTAMVLVYGALSFILLPKNKG